MDPFFPLLISLFIQRLYDLHAPIILSRETTYISAPLAENGRPDYEQYLLDVSRDGVDPANNAAIQILPILGPSEFGATEYSLVCKELGVDPQATKADALVSIQDDATLERIFDWLNKESFASFAVEDAEKLVEQAQTRPWSAAQAPPIADWLQENDRSLSLLVDAADKSEFYLPSPSLLDDRREMLLDMSLPHLTATRLACRSLSVRAMWKLGNGRLDQAWSDLWAVFRISRLLAQGHSIVEKIAGASIQHEASHATLALLADDHLAPPLAERMHQDLNSLPAFHGMADCIEPEDRITTLDTIVTNWDEGLRLFHLLAGGDENRHPAGHIIDGITVDWNVTLVRLNAWYDRLSAAGHKSTPQARSVALHALADDLEEFEIAARRSIPIFSGWFRSERRSEWVADAMVCLMLPALDLPIVVEDRTNAEFELLKLASALALYRAQNREYPETLEALTPAILDRLPIDAQSEKSFRYRRQDAGYLLYGVGLNGWDDGACNEIYEIADGRSIDELPDPEAARDQIPTDADDFSIRLPRPSFKLPGLPPGP